LAGEPDIVQPIAFTFGTRGRMWVVECLSYRKWKPGRQGTGKDFARAKSQPEESPRDQRAPVVRVMRQTTPVPG